MTVFPLLSRVSSTFSRHLFCPRRSHRPEYEVSWPKFLLVQLQQSWSGRWRWRGFGSAQPSGGHSSEAAHRRLPGVRRLPAPVGGRAGEPDPAAELSLSGTVARPPHRPVLHCRSPSHVQYLDRLAHKDTSVDEWYCSAQWVLLVWYLYCIMHLVYFDLSALLSVAIHPIQAHFYHLNLHLSQEAMWKDDLHWYAGKVLTLN